MVGRCSLWVVKQRHIMAVRSVEIFAAFTIFEIENPLRRVCLVFYKSVQSKSNYCELDLNVNISLLLIGKRVVTSILCPTMSRKKEVYPNYLVEHSCRWSFFTTKR